MRWVNTVSIRELRNSGGEVIARVAGGETLLVTRDGEPVARVTPLPRRPASAEVLPRVDADALQADIDDVLDPAL